MVFVKRGQEEGGRAIRGQAKVARVETHGIWVLVGFHDLTRID